MKHTGGRQEIRQQSDGQRKGGESHERQLRQNNQLHADLPITDRCNLHCSYCMPGNIEYFGMKELLPKEQILAVCRAAVSLGITRSKITGGEPLVRKDCVQLISEIKSLNDVEQVTLTTNGVLLEKQAGALKRAGVDCINVSLDTLDPRLYRQITGQDALEKVVAGILQAEKLDIPVHCRIQCFRRASTMSYGSR